MQNAILPSPEYLRARLDLDAERGTLTWRANALGSKSWNTRWAGKEAFTASFSGYRTGRIDGHQHLAHRVIWAMAHGEWPEGQIDHINGSRSDNRLYNLRVVGNTENARNASVSKNNTSGVTGVWVDNRRGHWCAEIKVDRKKIYLGSFASLEEATAARKLAEKIYGFHPNHGKQRK